MFVKLPKCLPSNRQTDGQTSRQTDRETMARRDDEDMGTSVASLAEHQRDLQFTYINNDRQQQQQAEGSSIRQHKPGQRGDT